MKKKGSFLKSFLMLFNPVIAVIYGILWFEFYKLAMYGDVNKRAPMLFGAFGFLLVWFLFYIMILARLGKHKKQEDDSQITWVEESKEAKDNHFIIKISGILMLLIFFGITGMGLYGIYYSSIPYNGKLSWEIESLNNEREITFTHNDISKYGVQGIFDDVNASVKMPKNLYLSGNLDFTYSKEGKITAFEAFVYGKNKQDQTQSYLISYDANKNAKIIVYLNNKVSANYDAGKDITPFFHIMKVLPLSQATQGWDESNYSVLYRGKRNWGYDASGIYMLDQTGSIQQANKDAVPVIGYSVSVYIKGKESSVTPRRYVATWEKEDMYKTKDTTDESSTGKIKIASSSEETSTVTQGETSQK